MYWFSFQGAGHNDVELHPQYYERLRKFLSVELIKWQLKINVEGGICNITSEGASNSNHMAASLKYTEKPQTPSTAKEHESNNKKNMHEDNDG